METWQGEAFICKSEKGALYLELDHEKAKTFIAKYNKRVLVLLNGFGPFHRALQLRKNGYALIGMSKSLLKEIKAEEGQLISFSIKKDTSEHGMAFSEEFKELLRQDEEAATIFNAFTDGQKRGLLHYVSSPKTEASRIKRAIEVAEKAKNGLLHFQKGGG